jgi:hypothetical protein
VALEILDERELDVDVANLAESPPDFLVASGRLVLAITSGHDGDEREEFANSSGCDSGVVDGIHRAVVNAVQLSSQYRRLLIEQ